MRKHYLDMKNNTVFAAVILCNVLLCLYFYFFELVNMQVSIIANLLSIAGAIGVSFSIQQSERDKDGVSKFADRESLQEIDIRRDNWFNEITEIEGITFLTGKSGIGKSYLLDQLVKNFEKKNISYTYKENNYFFDLKSDEMLEYEYIILDQFERALPFKNISRTIQLLKNLSQKKVIISVREERVGEVYNLFGFDKSINIVWLDYKENELRDIEDYLQKLFRGTKDDMKEHFLYSQILQDIENKRLSMLQLSLLGKEIQYMEESYVAEKINQYENDYDSVIKNFLQMQLDAYEYTDMAYMILYLLCQDQKNQYINEVMDFQNITIESEQKVRKTVDYLKRHNWIKKVKENENVRSELTEQYELSHDYFYELFNRLCTERIDSELRNNVKHYSTNCQRLRKEREEADSWKTYTNKICLNFMNVHSKRWYNMILYVMELCIIGFNIYFLSKSVVNRDICWTLILIDIVVGESIYYMYNYYYYFLSIYQNHYIIGAIIGCITCILPFILMDYWAVSLGVEICVVGTIMGFLWRRVRDREKPFFKARFFNFFCIGFIVALLGCFYKDYTKGSIILALPLFGLYGAYMLMGIINHINRGYMFSIVGKVLYGGRRMKIK